MHRCFYRYSRIASVPYVSPSPIRRRSLAFHLASNKPRPPFPTLITCPVHPRLILPSFHPALKHHRPPLRLTPTHSRCSRPRGNQTTQQASNTRSGRSPGPPPSFPRDPLPIPWTGKETQHNTTHTLPVFFRILPFSRRPVKTLEKLKSPPHLKISISIAKVPKHPTVFPTLHTPNKFRRRHSLRPSVLQTVTGMIRDKGRPKQ
ncbi:uncharacterized protein EI97DRAFT_66260 [Westerdykella ornata]|uniref:Uncharacterized protein n=1 Tax=Westerdykella ornata TaxID=318751 RepID=A0A6A6JHD5_WESOR|nr:uncharacterized protein EI97DRAFT_66260 [Westerdykella ornata]KAF2275625.1 hypothetical protein EI97DRAFT_66260 [Westerdykella ornata]